MSTIDLTGTGELEEERRKPGRKPGRPSERGKRSGENARSGSRRPSLEIRIREAIEAVAGWMIERGDDELGSTLDNDAGKMARVLADVARLNPFAKKAVSVLADVLEPIRAFGPTTRIVWARFLGWRSRRLEESELAEEELVGEATYVTSPGAPAPAEPEVAEPWRLDQ